MTLSGVAVRVTPVMGVAAAMAAGGGLWLLLTDPLSVARTLAKGDLWTLATMLVRALVDVVRSVLALV